MNFLWRFLYIIFISHFQKKIDLFDKTTITFRVMPTDIDILFHMNNGRYFSFLDLARANFLIRTNYFSRLKQHKIYGVVASEMIRFKKSLQLWQKFEIKTKVLGWDEKFFYIAHYFEVKNELYALALIKASFMRKKKSVATSEIFKIMNHVPNPPLLPNWVTDWLSAENQFYKAKTRNK